MPAILGALGGIGVGAGLGLGLGVLSDQARLGILWAKWNAHSPEWKTDRIAEALQNLLDAEKNEMTGLSGRGACDTIVKFIDNAMNLALHVDESLGMQLFVQMIQQTIAYATHTSHAGSIGTMANVYSGSMYLSGAEATEIGRNADYFDRYLNAFLSAEVGLNKPTLNFALVRGANQRLGDIFREMFSDMDMLRNEWNDLALSYYRHYHTMARERFADAIKMKETAVERAYGLLEQVANEHLARISEQLDTLEGAKSWYDAGFLSEDELNDIALRIDLERQASQINYTDVKTEVTNAITSAITTWDTKITVALGDLTDNETKFNILVKACLNVMFTNVSSFVEMLVGKVANALEDVNAYRNSERTIQIVHEFSTIPTEYYELEIFVDNMTVIS